jgi:hypothetical protein
MSKTKAKSHWHSAKEYSGTRAGCAVAVKANGEAVPSLRKVFTGRCRRKCEISSVSCYSLCHYTADAVRANPIMRKFC